MPEGWAKPRSKKDLKMNHLSGLVSEVRTRVADVGIWGKLSSVFPVGAARSIESPVSWMWMRRIHIGASTAQETERWTDKQSRKLKSKAVMMAGGAGAFPGFTTLRYASSLRHRYAGQNGYTVPQTYPVEDNWLKL
ncbi:Protein of unknown function [Pyronema omphalodes CBS 100304]|uniref:Uncharacterized protein n=1 Tax=Pyronema omphalodes (strain CBS 100304) TaxID=1076935 RepID=U4L0F0_PYROM|nr:Protein of unknown function [Pyronema omphalodes CBS 100304]